ncbi:MAG: MotA/TolQ/ExbB proton channel family protein [Candidatus Zixiibacteriota bacterium]
MVVHPNNNAENSNNGNHAEKSELGRPYRFIIVIVLPVILAYFFIVFFPIPKIAIDSETPTDSLNLKSLPLNADEQAQLNGSSAMSGSSESTQPAGESQTFIQGGNEKGQKTESVGERLAMEQDPRGLQISYWAADYYAKVVFWVYYGLMVMSLMLLARIVLFILDIRRFRYFFPKKNDLEVLEAKLRDLPEEDRWKELENKADERVHVGKLSELLQKLRLKAKHPTLESTSHFWSILKGLVTSDVLRKNKNNDYYSAYVVSAVNTVWREIQPAKILESIMQASPAVGFFGTLIGLLFIFTRSEGAGANLAGTPEFAVGLRVAIITSLWGLFNLGLAVLIRFGSGYVGNWYSSKMVAKAKRLWLML